MAAEGPLLRPHLPDVLWRPAIAGRVGLVIAISVSKARNVRFCWKLPFTRAAGMAAKSQSRTGRHRINDVRFWTNWPPRLRPRLPPRQSMQAVLVVRWSSRGRQSAALLCAERVRSRSLPLRQLSFVFSCVHWWAAKARGSAPFGSLRDLGECPWEKNLAIIDPVLCGHFESAPSYYPAGRHYLKRDAPPKRRR